MYFKKIEGKKVLHIADLITVYENKLCHFDTIYFCFIL